VNYVGRFAPSPTGPLHAGSIATAVASYLHARQHSGRWLLRIDDLDPPRCVPGSAEAIISLLERLELHWDGPVCYQSQRRHIHAEAAAGLLNAALAFRCDCSRRDLLRAHKATPLGVRYDGRCRDRDVPAVDSAVRVRVDSGETAFEDRLQGPQRIDLRRALGDYVVFRRDDLPAYHLAAVLDDAHQGVTAVVRGCDLLAATFVQIHLADLLGLPSVAYWHLPVLCNARGQKLSKQHRAASVAHMNVSAIAFGALRHLGAAPPHDLEGAAPGTLWQWAAEHWRIEDLAGQRQREVEADVAGNRA
jgi:glutamyl-Q tRNA(Asp) synthetase